MKHLLLIHGAIGASGQLIPLKNLLMEDFDVHLLEFDGHGARTGSDVTFTLESFQHQLEETLNEIGEPVHIFGYSMGGFIALLSLAEGNEQIASLTTLGTKMKWNEEIAAKEKKQLNPAVIKEKVPKFAEVLRRRHGHNWESVLHKTTDFMQELGRLQPISQTSMRRIKKPVQLCLADQDGMVSKEETTEVNSWIERSDFKMIHNSKHPIEQVDLTMLADIIRSFIQKQE